MLRALTRWGATNYLLLLLLLCMWMTDDRKAHVLYLTTTSSQLPAVNGYQTKPNKTKTAVFLSLLLPTWNSFTQCLNFTQTTSDWVHQFKKRDPQTKSQNEPIRKPNQLLEGVGRRMVVGRWGGGGGRIEKNMIKSKKIKTCTFDFTQPRGFAMGAWWKQKQTKKSWK